MMKIMNKKGFAAIPVILGVAVVVVSAVVLYFGVQRIQDLRTVLERPKATGTTSWPACAKEGPYAYQGDLGCCSNIASQGSDACLWPARGWCKPDQCAAGIDIPNNCSQCGDPAGTAANGCSDNQCWQTCYGKSDCQAAHGGNDGYCVSKSRGCRCGLYYQDSSSTCGTSSENGALYTATYPTVGTTNVSLTPTFTWTGSMPANNNYKDICVGTWVNSSSCESLGCRAVTGQDSYTMPTALSSNTTYGWTVYSAYNPGTLNVTNMSGGCQSFTTGGGGGGTVPNCSVTSPSGANLVTGTNYTFSTTGSGSLTSIQADRILSSQVYSNPQPWTHICQTNSTSCSGTTNFSTPGQYYITCNASTATQKCSGDPSCRTNGGNTDCGAAWLDCGPSDNTLVTVAAAQGGGTIPNCTNLTGPDTLTVGQPGTYSANFSSPQGNLGGEIVVGQNGNWSTAWQPGSQSIPGNSGSRSFTWTPTVAGTYDVFCRSWNDGVAECRGKSNYVDGPPRYACAGPSSSMTVTVAAAQTCQITTASMPTDPFRVGDPDRVFGIFKTPDNAQVVCTSSNPGIVSIVSGCTYRAVSAGDAVITAQLTLNGANCGSPTSATVNVGASHLSCALSTSGASVCSRIAGTGADTCSPVGSACQSSGCTGNSQCRDNEACQSGRCQPLLCVTPPDAACWEMAAVNHQCSRRNLSNGTACNIQAGGGSGTCQNGVCTATNPCAGQADGTVCTGSDATKNYACFSQQCVVAHLGCISSGNSCVYTQGDGNNADSCQAARTTICVPEARLAADVWTFTTAAAQAPVTIAGWKTLENKLPNDQANAGFTLTAVPVFMDGVAAIELDSTQIPILPNSFQFRAPVGKHTLSVKGPSGYTVSHDLCESSTNCNWGLDAVPGDSVNVNVTENNVSNLVWVFSPVSVAECTTDSQCADDKACKNNQCVTPECSKRPQTVCQAFEYKNHACSLKNLADGTACETNKVCSNGACVTPTVPMITNVAISSATVMADNTTQYTISATATDPNGATDIYDLSAMINYQGENAGAYRGHPVWQIADNYPSADYPEKKACIGVGGWAVIKPGVWSQKDGTGPYYLHLDACSVANSGNSRTVKFLVRFDPAYTTPTTDNDISGLAFRQGQSDYSWTNFQTNFALGQSEVNACWDNKGTNGKCYDCNGDGTINILDFSCFQKHWLKNVE